MEVVFRTSIDMFFWTYLLAVLDFFKSSYGENLVHILYFFCELFYPGCLLSKYLRHYKLIIPFYFRKTSILSRISEMHFGETCLIYVRALERSKKPRPKDFYHDYLAEQMLNGKTKPDKV